MGPAGSRVTLDLTPGMGERGLVVVVSGPSGVGKGSVHAGLHGLLEGLQMSVSVTTRSPRPGERDGIDYHFVDEAGFERMVASDALLEWAEYAGNRYGTPREPLDRAVTDGRTVLLEIEVQGALQIRSRLPEALLIFLVPPAFDELERRLRDRGTEDEVTIQARLEVARAEMGAQDAFDHVVVNDDLDRATGEVARLIARARSGL
jgi:guanylate kinase